MLSAVAWVPRGAARSVPAVAEPTEEELEAMKQEAEAGGEAREQEGDEEDEEGEEGEEEEGSAEEGGGDHAEVDGGKGAAAERALSAAQAMQQSKGKGPAADLAEELADLDMEAYDDEADREINLFGTGKGDGGAYYRSNEEDPYLVDQDDEDEDDIDDLTIRPTDLLLLAARNEDDVSFIELWVCEEPEGRGADDDAAGDDFNMYVHHDIMLPAFPLAMTWMDFNAKGAMGASTSHAAASSSSQGNFVAVATMNPEIEIWDLDVLDEVEPAVTLGGHLGSSRVLEGKENEIKEKGKGKKKLGKTKKKSKRGEELKTGSHRGAVMALAWNSEFRNVLASGGEDHAVKVWDMTTQACQHTLTHHSGKVQSVAWCPLQPTVLLSGSFDKTVALVDGRTPDQPCERWAVSADVEATVWDPHVEHRLLVSTEDGLVCAFDARALPSTGGQPQGKQKHSLFTLSAHDKATCTMSFNAKVPHLLATGSTDRKVKLWDMSADLPKCLATHNPRAGAVFSAAFCADVPSILAIGGSKGSVHLLDVSNLKTVAPLFS